jgi:hypothetical protein
MAPLYAISSGVDTYVSHEDDLYVLCITTRRIISQ